MKILVINGANLNMLGIREREIYGDADYSSLVKFVKESAKREGVHVKCVQSNSEGRIVDIIQRAYHRYDGLIINAGAYTHTSVAILDALKAVAIPTVEVHISDIARREEFRKFSYISLYAMATVAGEGFEGYNRAIQILKASQTEKR